MRAARQECHLRLGLAYICLECERNCHRPGLAGLSELRNGNRLGGSNRLIEGDQSRCNASNERKAEEISGPAHLGSLTGEDFSLGLGSSVMLSQQPVGL